MGTHKKYSIGELTELTGVTRRSVHYYVQLGLLAPPAGAGRGHYYTDDHRTALQRIRAWQSEGRSLGEIAVLLRRAGQGATGSPSCRPSTGDPCSARGDLERERDDTAVQAPSPEMAACVTGGPDGQRGLPPARETGELWLRLDIATGIELHLAAGSFRPSPARLRRLQALVRRLLDPDRPFDDDENEDPS